MRIIAGTLKGRLFNSPNGHRTHPMSDKSRGALFNSLGDITGLTILDAFAGSGALSFEAISRGASTAIAIDADRNAQRAIEENIRILDLEMKVKLIKASAGSWFDTTVSLFDIVLLDPPYDSLQPALLDKMASRCKPEGIVVLSWPGNMPIPAFTRTIFLQQNSYGDSQLIFYRKVS